MRKESSQAVAAASDEGDEAAPRADRLAVIVTASGLLDGAGDGPAHGEAGAQDRSTADSTAEYARAVLPSRSIASREQRRGCPHYQRVGCLLDVMEKTCEPDEGPAAMQLQMHREESLYMCCCPTPYKSCAAEERSPACDRAFKEFIHPLGADVTPQALGDAIQMVRGRMLADGGEACSVLARAEPLSKCGRQGSPPVQRSLEREDLFCEMLTWQFEELGDGNPDEFKRNNCPYVRSRKAKAGKGKDARKGQRLTPKELPLDWFDRVDASAAAHTAGTHVDVMESEL